MFSKRIEINGPVQHMTKEKRNGDELISMSLGDHLDELRARLILSLTGLVAAFVLSLFAGKWFLRIVLSPYEIAMKDLGMELKLLAIDVPEPFLVYLRASLVLGVLISSPWLFYQIWAFVSAGLYKHERRFVRVVAPASAMLFVIGALFFLLVIAPWVFKFFVRFNPGIDYMNYQPSLTKSVNFILILSLVFGLAFQSPIAIVFAERMGLVTVESLSSGRKYVFLGCFVVSAIATPPDVVSQISLAIPLYILYEGSIVVCRIWRKKRSH
jgi:sec-independent protein translocase protein TatC